MTNITKDLAGASPAIVRVLLVDGSHRDLRPATGTRKRWLPIVQMLEQLAWSRIECLDPRGAVLRLIDNPDRPAVEPIAPPAREESQDDRMMRRLVEAQREAATWQDRSVRAALDTCVQVMAQMADAVQAITELHRQEREHMRGVVREMERAVAAAGAQGDEQLPQAELLKAIAPALLAKLMAPPSTGQ